MTLSLHPGAGGQETDWIFCFFFFQEIKKAILSDLTKLGKEAGLKSFEQVMFKVCRINFYSNYHDCNST